MVEAELERLAQRAMGDELAERMVFEPTAELACGHPELFGRSDHLGGGRHA